MIPFRLTKSAVRAYPFHAAVNPAAGFDSPEPRGTKGASHWIAPFFVHAWPTVFNGGTVRGAFGPPASLGRSVNPYGSATLLTGGGGRNDRNQRNTTMAKNAKASPARKNSTEDLIKTHRHLKEEIADLRQKKSALFGELLGFQRKYAEQLRRIEAYAKIEQSPLDPHTEAAELTHLLEAMLNLSADAEARALSGQDIYALLQPIKTKAQRVLASLS